MTRMSAALRAALDLTGLDADETEARDRAPCASRRRRADRSPRSASRRASSPGGRRAGRHRRCSVATVANFPAGATTPAARAPRPSARVADGADGGRRRLAVRWPAPRATATAPLAVVAEAARGDGGRAR